MYFFHFHRCVGHSLCSQYGEPEASGAAALKGRFPQRGAHLGQHSETAELSEGLQRRYPLANAALGRIG